MAKTSKKPSRPPLSPLGDRVLIDAPPTAKPGTEKLIGGIIIPPMASHAAQIALESPHFETVVLAVGSECKLVGVGDRIVVRGPDCFTVKLGAVEHAMVREQNIVAVLP